MIRAESDLERAALGYLAGNCSHCHNPNSEAFGDDELDLRHHVAREALVDVEPDRLVLRDATLRVKSGEPDSSVLFRLFERSFSGDSHRDREIMMPPIGNAIVDPEGLEILRAWISSLDS